jgi:hypothetical protein
MRSPIQISSLRHAFVLVSFIVIIIQKYRSITKQLPKALCKYLDRTWFWQALRFCAWVLYRIESCQKLLYQFFMHIM